jgi:hypothetical protein
MHPNNVYEPSCFAKQRLLQEGSLPHGLPREATLQLTKRASMILVLALSIGLWAAIWAALASLASATFG